MSVIDKMKDMSILLNKLGFTPILPGEDDRDSIPQDKRNEYKREVSMRHFSEIAKADTYAILVVNELKNGISNYIGANTFAEVAIAFYFGKKIFLLNDIYDKLSDELLGWGAVPLHGEIQNIDT